MKTEIKTLKAHGKINLFLLAGRRDEKGYHPLKTVFQPLDLCDEIIIKKTDGSGGIRLSSNEKIPLDERNSVYRAIKKICEKTKTRMETLNYIIHIEKRIPIASGLGGSAVDAAPVLKFLNEDLNLKLSQNDISEIAAEIGADVPQALYKHATYAEGYGDIIIRHYDLPKRYVCIYIPNHYMKDYPSKTPILYEMLDEEKRRLGYDYDALLITKLSSLKKEMEEKNWKKIGDFAHNDFELVAFKLHPELKNIKRIMAENGSQCTLLSGSGGAVFGIYETPYESLRAAIEIEKEVGRESGKIILTETL